MLRLEATIEVGEQSKRLELETEEQVIHIGRESKNDLQLPLTTVSRQHCRISMSDNQYFIEDLGSSHGTVLNQQKLHPNEKKLLRSGDTVTISKVKIGVTITKHDLQRTPGEKTEALALRAVEDILGQLGSGGDKHEVAFLRVMSGPDEGTKFPLRGAAVECVLGRSRECELVVNDPNASRRHGVVRKDYSGITYQCLGAKNLALVNGREVPRNGFKKLKDRDEIQIGSVKVVFIDPDADLLRSIGDIPGFEESEPGSQPELESSLGGEASSAADALPGENSGDGEASGVGEPVAGEDSVASDAPSETPMEEPSEGPPAEALSDGNKPELPLPGMEMAMDHEPRGARLGPELLLVVVGGLVVVLGVIVLALLL